MKKGILLLTLMVVALMGPAQTLVFSGSDSLQKNVTLTSPVITVSETGVAQVIPFAQLYMDYKTGTAKAYVTGWHSLDKVRWDTIPGFAYTMTGKADVQLNWEWTDASYESPLLTKYIKFTARAIDSTQLIFPKGYFAYKKLP